MKNKKLDGFLDELETHIGMLEGRDGFKEIFQKVRAYQSANGELTYDFAGHWQNAILLTILTFTFGYLALECPLIVAEYAFFGWPYWSHLLGVICLGGLIGVISNGWNKSTRVGELSDWLNNIDRNLDTKIEELDTDGEYNRLDSKFGEFSRGDESQDITELCQIRYDDGTYKRNFQYYCFKYVKVTRITTKHGTTTIRTTYYRYGVTLELPLNAEILLNNDGGGSNNHNSQYEPASNSFNRAYTAYGESEHAIALFLKPAVAVLFENLLQKFSDVRFEMVNGGQACLAFSDDDLLYRPRVHSLNEPDEFEAELAGVKRPKKIAVLLELFRQIEFHNT